MSVLEFNTDAYGHSNEHATINTNGDQFIAAQRMGYGVGASIIGIQGTTCNYSIVGDKGGRNSEGEFTFTNRMSLSTPSTVWGNNSQYFINKYGESKAQTFIDEYTSFYDWHLAMGSGYICAENVPDYAAGVSTYDGSLSGCGLCTPNGSGFGSPQANDYNMSARAHWSYSTNSDGSARTNNRDPYDIFSYLGLARDVLKYEFSEIMNEMIDDNYVAIAKESSVDWTVNIDGNSSIANISLTWNAPYMKGIDNASVEIKVIDSEISNPTIAKYLGRQSYNGQPYTETWASLYEKGATSIEALEKLRQFLDNLVSFVKAHVVLYFKMDYFFDGLDIETSWCYCVLNQQGEAVKYGVWSENSDGSTVTITHRNTDDVIADFEDDIDEDIDMEGSAVSGLSLMTKSYSMTTSRLKQLGDFLWNSDFCDVVHLLNNNPIQNIISTKVFPFSIGGGADTNIILGNINTGINGNPIQENSTYKIEIGSFTIPKYYNNWIDYDSVVGVFLPFCGGFHSLDTESIMGKRISFTYYVDILTGVCKAVMYVNDIAVQEFGGQIGFDIPLCSQDRTQTEMEQLNSLHNAIGSLTKSKQVKNKESGEMERQATPDFWGAASSTLDYISPHDYFYTVGSLSPMVNMMTTHDVFIVIERPIVQYPSNYNHVYGRPCNLTLSLNGLKGFTMCENVDCSSVPCTGEEKMMIKRFLESGVYL